MPQRVTTRSSLGRFLQCIVLLPPLICAFAVAGGLADPVQVSRQGILNIERGWEFPLPPAPPDFPLTPLDRDATEGVRHGWVQTTSGRFGFSTVDLTLPSRVP
jgi:hypothetical protein